MLLFTLLLSGCFWSGNYQVEREGMPEELKTQMETQITTGRELLDAAATDTEKLTALLEIAYASEQLGDLATAIDYYEDMLVLEENNFQALNNLGVIYEEVEEYENSALYYGRLLNANPNNTEALSDTIRALLLAQHFEDAQSTLEAFARENQDAENPQITTFISNQYQKILDAKNASNE